MERRSEAGKKSTSSSPPQLHPVTRREVLAGGAATIAFAFVPLSALRFPPTLPAAAKEILTPTERQSLEAMVSRIIPADANGPGALEAGCARYIEYALEAAYQAQRPAYSKGLATLNSYAMSKAGKAFAALTATEQDGILTEFEHGAKVGDYADSASFFEMVRRHTLEGMFGDPSYGGNADFAGWDLIGYPGPRMYVSPDMQKMDAKIPRSHVSAKQIMHGSH
ncbi:MAG: gluconate 2-dehydrogenase subunit 3 family protein [Candidatus Sulfotelmatobacter sp.]